MKQCEEICETARRPKIRKRVHAHCKSQLHQISQASRNFFNYHHSSIVRHSTAPSYPSIENSSVLSHGLFQCLVPLLVHLPLLFQHAKLLLLVLVDDLDLGDGLVLADAANAEVITAAADVEVITAAAGGWYACPLLLRRCLLAGDSFSLLLSFLLFSLLDTSSLSLRLGTLTSRSRRASDDAADVDLDDRSLLFSLTLRIGEGDSRRRLSGESAAGVAARGRRPGSSGR